MAFTTRTDSSRRMRGLLIGAPRRIAYWAKVGEQAARALGAAHDRVAFEAMLEWQKRPCPIGPLDVNGTNPATSVSGVVRGLEGRNWQPMQFHVPAIRWKTVIDEHRLWRLNP